MIISIIIPASANVLSPLKQFKSGIATKNVQCKNNLQLVIKSTDGTPACVRYDTAQILIQRGWTKEIVSQIKTQTSLTQVIQSIAPCQIQFEKNTSSIQVLYMPLNSSGMLCVRYSNLSQNTIPVGIKILESNNLAQQAHDIVIRANATSIMPGDSLVTYEIKTGSHPGFYQLSVFCSGMPLAIGYDDKSRIVTDDFPWLHLSTYCPLSSYNYNVVGLNGIGVTNLP